MRSLRDDGQTAPFYLSSLPRTNKQRRSFLARSMVGRMARNNPMIAAALSMRRVALHRPTIHHPALSPSPSTSTCRCRRRTIVTSSTSPSPDVFIERPEVVVLSESSFYHDGNNSWNDPSMSYFPRCGLQYANIDVFRSPTSGRRRRSNGAPHPHPTLDDLERTMAEDLSRLIVIDDVYDDEEIIEDAATTTTSDSAHVLLIVRGPIQCLVAQYFLER